MEEEDSPPVTGKSVGIIGAGMTGLCACKHLMHHGFKPTVLEARDCIGGVWRHTCSITRLQTPRDGYQFSDFLWPEGTPIYPHNEQVVDYLESYAHHFHLTERILFNCKVVEIKSSPMAGWADGSAFARHDIGEKFWAVRVERRGHDGQIENEWLHFDFLVTCVGRFGDCPMYPTFNPPGRGPGVFSGMLLHAMDYGMLHNEAARELVSHKRVVVVGYMKSAIELAIEATSDASQGIHGHPCHLIFRTTNWVFVNRKPFAKLVALLYFTRFAELMNYKPGQGWLLSLLSKCLSPLKWVGSKLAELYLLLHFPLCKYGLVPKHSFSEYASSCKSFLLPEEFFPRVEKGQIVLHRTDDWGFCKDGVVLEDGTFLPADVVILGTGYDGHKKLCSLLPPQYSQRLMDPNSGVVPLYRGVVHPRIPHLAILGYQLKFSHLHASEMGARWLAHLLMGRFHLPSVPEMERDAQAWIAHMHAVSPNFPQQACLGASGIWHSDQMCRDMGWKPWRKKGVLQEFFSPYSNMDYKDS